MSQFGGKDSKRHFTVVIGNKEHGLYVSSTPSSAAKKAVTKLCTANKSKKVEFSIREITQGSKKKTYGPYKGYIEKLKEPIELKGRVIRYKPVAKLSGKSSAKKGGMKGGYGELILSYKYRCSAIANSGRDDRTTIMVEQAKKLNDFCKNEDTKNIFRFNDNFSHIGDDMVSAETSISFEEYDQARKTFEYNKIIEELIKLIKNIKKSFEKLSTKQDFELVIPNPNNSSENELVNNNRSNRSNISDYSYKEFLTYLHKELKK
jgi:hypothetical protein